MSAGQAEESRRNAAEFRRTAVRKMRTAAVDLNYAVDEYRRTGASESASTTEDVLDNLTELIDELEEQ